MPRNSSLDDVYFERLYATDRDPWQFETSSYEAEKYDATLAMLAGERFASGLEIGCSVGVLTAKLAAVCDALLSVDINERALGAARERCSTLSNVRFERMAVPSEFPDARFDFVLVSEVAYYWSDDDLQRAMDRIAEAAPGGTLELVHFLPAVDDYVRDGDAVHEAFLSDGRFARIRGSRAEKYRIDVLRIR
jgi:SAM-dependent methyltransferase